MSNPSVCFLSSIEIDKVNFRIEDNIGESVHIHIGKIRVELSIDEFFMLAEGIMEAAQQLFQIRKLELRTFDIESLKWDWLKNYEKIESIQVEYTTLDSLYIKESYIKHRAIKRIIPLKESGYIKVLKGDRSDIDYYETPGKLEPSRKQKLEYIEQRIKTEKYPLEEKLILVDQEGYVYDGIKRASILYYLHGGNEYIPVLRMKLRKKRSLEEEIKCAEKAIEEWNKQNRSVQHIQRWMGENPVDEMNNEIAKLSEITLKEFIEFINEMEIPFFLIKRKKINKNGEIIAVATIIVEEGKLDVVQKRLNIPQYHTSPYGDYKFLYTAQEPLCYLIQDGFVLVSDRLCCKNKFEKYLLPADRFILEKSWKHRKWNESWRCYFAGDDIYLIVILMEVIFESEQFDLEDKAFIEKNKDILCQKEFKDMLNKEFYQYTEILIKYLLLGEYDHAVSMYECFSDY